MKFRYITSTFISIIIKIVDILFVPKIYHITLKTIRFCFGLIYKNPDLYIQRKLDLKQRKKNRTRTYMLPSLLNISITKNSCRRLREAREYGVVAEYILPQFYWQIPGLHCKNCHHAINWHGENSVCGAKFIYEFDDGTRERSYCGCETSTDKIKLDGIISNSDSDICKIL